MLQNNTEFYLIAYDYNFGEDSFEFQVRDIVGDVSSPSTVHIDITHVNHPPAAYFTSPLVAVRTVPLTIEIGVEDGDIPEEFDFNVTYAQAGDGVFQFGDVDFGGK